MSTAARKDHIKKFYGIDEGEADESSDEDDEEDKGEDASEQEDSSDDADANAGPKLGVLYKTACQKSTITFMPYEFIDRSTHASGTLALYACMHG